MTVSVSDALKAAFGSLTTGAGQKTAAVFFVLQAVNFGASLFMLHGPGLVHVEVAAVLVIGAAIITAILRIIAMIGGLRSLRENDFDTDYFTSNLKWPFPRFIGAQFTSGVFAYLLGGIFFLPGLLGLIGTGTNLLNGTAVGMTGIIPGILGLIGLIIGAAVFAYITVTLILAQPLVAIEDRRLFQSLDESIRRTRGNRLTIFLAAVTIVIIYLAIAAAALTPATLLNLSIVGSAIVTLVIVPVFTVVGLGFLNYLTEELPRP